MKKCWPVLLLLAFVSCSDRKVDLSGETKINTVDFLALFPLVNGAYTVADSNIHRLADTVTIGYKAMQQLIPDSALTDITGDDATLAIHPLARIQKDKETYLLASFVNKKKTNRVGVFVLDKKAKFLAAKLLLVTGANDGYSHAVSINREPTFLMIREKRMPDNTTLYSRTGWVYNNAGFFMVVMNDSNEDTKKLALVNPLDTLPKKNKLSGDYVKDKKNFISLRDSKKPNTYLIFVHFEKNGGACTGELKGELNMKDTNRGQYAGKGDPCVVDFTFDGNQLSMKEQGTCGNHRGMKCFFDDTFTKKKEVKKKK